MNDLRANRLSSAANQRSSPVFLVRQYTTNLLSDENYVGDNYE